MTPQQYKHEATQNAIDRYTKAKTEEEKQDALVIVNECFSAFWTDERKMDYVKYYKSPNGSVCARFKEG